MKKYVTKKSVDKDLRETYGWTQMQLAAYLGVTRSQLAMSESGERSLPAAAALKWLEWVKFTYVDATLQKAKAALPLPEPTAVNMLNQVTDCELEATILQSKLAAILLRYEQALNNMALCQHLLIITPDIEENAFARQQLSLTYSIATATQKSEGPEAHALLQCKIDGLLYEAKQCRQRAAAFEKGGKNETP